MPHSRVLIVSDTHLGRPRHAARSAEALRPLWQGCDQLIINGDVAEVHHPTHWARAARHVLRLFDLCEEDGVQLTLLSGNHDPFISDVRHLHLCGQQVFIMHGDALHPAVAPWSPRARRMRLAHAQALASIAPELRETLQARLSASQHASSVNLEHLQREAARSTIRSMLMRPWAIAQVAWYWRRFPRLAAQFVEQHSPDTRFAIVGHTHRPGIWHVNDRAIINTGSFGFPGAPRAVTVDDDRVLSVWRIKTTQRAYSMENQPVAAFELTASAAPRMPSAALQTLGH